MYFNKLGLCSSKNPIDFSDKQLLFIELTYFAKMILIFNISSMAFFSSKIQNIWPHNFKNIAKGGATSQTAIWQLILFLVTIVVVFGFVVFIDGGERKVPVQYAKQMKGRKMYGGQSTYIPVRVNANGVMPIIFASSILTFPQLICSIFDADSSWGFTKWWSNGWVQEHGFTQFS